MCKCEYTYLYMHVWICDDMHTTADIKKECNVNCFEFFFFSVFLMDVMRGKITINLKELH